MAQPLPEEEGKEEGGSVMSVVLVDHASYGPASSQLVRRQQALPGQTALRIHVDAHGTCSPWVVRGPLVAS